MAQSEAVQPVSIQITCDIPFALYSEGEFAVRSPHGQSTVSLRRIRQERLDPRVGIERGDFDVRGDRSGFVSYSNLIIRMDWLTFDNVAREVGGKSNVEVISNVASYVVNRVIESYRLATRTSWVHTISGKELFRLVAHITRSDGVVEVIQVGFSGVGTITLPVTGLTDEAQHAFEQSLLAGEEPPIWDSLWLDAEDAVDRGDPRSAVIWGHSALETLAHATVLAWLRDQDLDVGAAADRIGRSSDERRNLRQSLSLEELAEFLNDSRKVELALFDVIGVDPSWGYDRYAKFEELAAARNDVLHSGAEITLAEAQDHLQVIRAIRAELSRKANLDRIAQSRPRSASAVIAELLGHALHRRLVDLLASYEDSGVEVTVWSRHRHPLPRQRYSSGVSIVGDRKRLRIYLPRRSELGSVDIELELARLLLKSIVIDEGWPFADVLERGSEGELTLGPINWEGYAQVAAVITDAVLGSEIDRRLAEEGFSVDLRVRRVAEAITSRLNEPTFVEPRWGDFDYFLLPIRIVATFLNAPDPAASLIELLKSRAPELERVVREVIDWIHRLGWQTPESAATGMLVLKSRLGILDTIGVREAPERHLRTRLTERELQRLKGTGEPQELA